VQTSLRGYSEKDVSSLLGLPVRQIRSYARDGLLSEGGGMLSFEDVVLLRAVKKLVDSDVAPRRVRRMLRLLRDQVPPETPLSALRLSVEAARS